MKLINECPVCHSKNLQQKLSTTVYDRGLTVYPTGSFCNDCGVVLVFNTTHVDEDTKRETNFIKLTVEKNKILFGMPATEPQ